MNSVYEIANRQELIDKGAGTIVAIIEDQANQCLEIGYNAGLFKGILVGAAAGMVGTAAGIVLGVYFAKRKSVNKNEGK